MVFVEIVLLLLVILVAAEVFTNALEHLGERLKISEGVTGSLFAAVGTALPETMVPLLAIFSGGKNVQHKIKKIYMNKKTFNKNITKIDNLQIAMSIYM